MKSFAAIMFASGALASLAPYPYPAEHSPAVYPTGAVPSKNPHESAPYPYPTEKKETSTTCTEDKHSATKPASTYYTKHESASTYYSTVDKHSSASTYYSTVDKHSTTTDSATKVYVTKTYEYEYQKPTDVVTTTITKVYGTITKTETVVVVKPTAPVYQTGATETVVIVKPTAPVYTKEATVTETVNVYITAPVATASVCVPAAETTVTVTESLTLTIPLKPTGTSNKTVIVTPVVYTPTAPGSYAPAQPTPYSPAANGTTTSVYKPTYSAPVQYTGGAAKAAAGFGTLAIAVIALAL